MPSITLIASPDPRPRDWSYVEEIAHIYTTCYSGRHRQADKIIAKLDRGVNYYVAKQKVILENGGIVRHTVKEAVLTIKEEAASMRTTASKIIKGARARNAARRVTAEKSEGALMRFFRKASKGAGKWVEKGLKLFK